MLQLKQLMHKSLLAILGSAAIAASSIAVADSALLDIAKAKSDQCVADTKEMRANHMEKILHQRDKTLREGIRTKQHSLKECINCHVEKNSAARFGDNKHFCSSCHNFAAVTIDCFQCHADRPDSDKKHSLNTSSFPHYADNSAEGVSK
ncbi:MAG: hypothetical protein OQK76_11070 [Gammaproteobacteria bacterium]|nr:hypothetical protein [Gammaproteobacteria bacterium]MCW8911145.1 hypothetical protein [Gammaproteobacteria bacterium]MCW9005739.1 hypothetical protein [Gammaproteobacteria bacterium]MCW9055893.1 hypothetical protein [Gammaproteobacteria bacterium]